MRIIQVYSSFLPNIGGIELNMYNLAKRLVNRGHEVTVLTTKLMGEKVALPHEEIIDGIRVRRLDVLPVRPAYRLAITPLIIAGNYLDADVLHVFSFLPQFLTNIACVKSRIKKIPLVVTPTYYPKRYSIYSGFIGAIMKFYETTIGPKILRMADHVIALTEKEASYWRGFGIKNVSVIPIGTESYRSKCKSKGELEFRRGFHDCTILSVGRLHWYKGIQYLIKAMPIVLKKFPNAMVLIVGPDAGYQSHLEALANSLKIRKKIIFTGRLSFDELSHAYQIADVVVVPSLYESFSHVVIEAWLHKKPVVVTEGVGLAGLVTHHKGGLVVPVKDHRALASSIIKIFSKRKYAKSLGGNGEKLVKKKFIWKLSVDKLEHIYSKIQKSNGHL